VTIIVVSPTSPLTFFWDIVLSMGYEIQIEREINLEKRTKERERERKRQGFCGEDDRGGKKISEKDFVGRSKEGEEKSYSVRE
jgi:hypothetical protein